MGEGEISTLPPGSRLLLCPRDPSTRVFQAQAWDLTDWDLQPNLPQRIHDSAERTLVTYKNWRVIAKGGAYVRGEELAEMGIAQMGIVLS